MRPAAKNISIDKKHLIGISFIPKASVDLPLRDTSVGEMCLDWCSGGSKMWYYLGDTPPSSCGPTYYHGMMTLPNGSTHRLYSFDKEDSDAV